jgi:hypothetical protein
MFCPAAACFEEIPALQRIAPPKLIILRPLICGFAPPLGPAR